MDFLRSYIVAEFQRMATKVIFLALVFVFVSQARSATLTEVRQDIIVQNIFDDAARLLAELESVARDTINAAIESLRILLDSVKEAAQGIIQDITSTLQQLFEDLVNKIEEIKKQAEEVNVDITECTDEREDRLKALNDQLVNSTVSCVNVALEEAIDAVARASEDVKNSIEEVTDITKELKNCGSDLGSIPCVTNVVAKIGLKIVQLPVEIKARELEAGKDIVEINLRMAACGADVAGRLVIEGGQIVGEIEECAIAKINE